MIGTLALVTLGLLGTESKDFSHSFKKDESVSYVIELSGDLGGAELKGKIELSSTTKELTEKGAKVSVEVTTSKLTVDGAEFPGDDLLGKYTIELDEHGAPKTMESSGARSVVYLLFLTAYLPKASLNVSDSFEISAKCDDFSYQGKGNYAADEKWEGKNVAVLKTKCTFTPGSQESGPIEGKLMFDLETGKIVASEHVLGTPDGDVTMKVRLKA